MRDAAEEERATHEFKLLGGGMPVGPAGIRWGKCQLPLPGSSLDLYRFLLILVFADVGGKEKKTKSICFNLLIFVLA